MKNDTEKPILEMTHSIVVDDLLSLFTDGARHFIHAKNGITPDQAIASVGLELRYGRLCLLIGVTGSEDMQTYSPLLLSTIDDVTERSRHQQNVELFMTLAGQEVPDIPTIPSEDVRRLRARLTLEEALEQIKALGFEPMLHGVQLTMEGVEFDHDPDLISLPEIIDGACDLRVIATGTLSACGVCDQVPQELVDESNLNKFGEGGYRREDGKWMKPADWTPPDWEAEIKRQSERVGDE